MANFTLENENNHRQWINWTLYSDPQGECSPIKTMPIFFWDHQTKIFSVLTFENT